MTLEGSPINKRMIFEYLEEKIMNDESTDLEYQLYIDIKKIGSEALLLNKENKTTAKKLIKEMKQYYDYGV